MWSAESHWPTLTQLTRSPSTVIGVQMLVFDQFNEQSPDHSLSYKVNEGKSKDQIIYLDQ